jgi:hypothetical protein
VFWGSNKSNVLETGMSTVPMFASMMPEVMSMGVNWGTESPPGGTGPCLMQLEGTFYNASCEQYAHFSCEQKPIPNDMTTAYIFLFKQLNILLT